MRSRECQLSREHTILDRAANRAIQTQAADRCPLNLHHYRVSRPSPQLLSWLNKKVCFERSETANTVCVMVVFPSLGSELQMRSLLKKP